MNNMGWFVPLIESTLSGKKSSVKNDEIFKMLKEVKNSSAKFFKTLSILTDEFFFVGESL